MESKRSSIEAIAFRRGALAQTQDLQDDEVLCNLDF